MKERKEFVELRVWQRNAQGNAQFSRIKKRNIDDIEFLPLSLVPKNLIIFLHHHIISFEYVTKIWYLFYM